MNLACHWSKTRWGQKGRFDGVGHLSLNKFLHVKGSLTQREAIRYLITSFEIFISWSYAAGKISCARSKTRITNLRLIPLSHGFLFSLVGINPLLEFVYENQTHQNKTSCDRVSVLFRGMNRCGRWMMSPSIIQLWLALMQKIKMPFPQYSSVEYAHWSFENHAN